MRDEHLRIALTTLWLLACAPADQTRHPPNVAGNAGERGGTSAIGGLVAGQGSFTGNTSGQAAVGVGAPDGDLSVHVEDDGKLELTVITLACAGGCADIEAVASGGNPPYSFVWEDGSQNAKRRVCLDVSKSLRITVTDTAIDAAEFGHAATMASADVMAIVSACSSDAGAPPPTTCAQEVGPATCRLPSGAILPEDITVKLLDERQYFAGGTIYPLGATD